MAAYEKVIEIAKAENGYLEKRSNSQLDSKTANAGSNNYTKYWRDLAGWGLGNYQAQYWCAAFVHWCFVKAYGLAAAKKLLLHAPYISCDTLAVKSNAAGQRYVSPKAGDVVVFYNGSRYNHTGIVYKVSGGYFYTIEGNTSGASGVVSNGGGVVVGKKYRVAGTSHRFHRPNYSAVSGSAPSTPAARKNNVEKGQRWLNENYKKTIKTGTGKLLEVDGEYGTHSRWAALATWKDVANRKFGCSLDIKNQNFFDSCKKAAKKATIQNGSSGTFAYIVEFILSAKGYYTGKMDANFGSGLEAAVKAFQRKRGLGVDGVVGSDTWYALFN